MLRRLHADPQPVRRFPFACKSRIGEGCDRSGHTVVAAVAEQLLELRGVSERLRVTTVRILSAAS
jgi:hypothetical protein